MKYLFAMYNSELITAIKGIITEAQKFQNFVEFRTFRNFNCYFLICSKVNSFKISFQKFKFFKTWLNILDSNYPRLFKVILKQDSATAFSRMTISITTFSIIGLIVTFCITNIQHDATQHKHWESLYRVSLVLRSHFSIVMLNVALLSVIILGDIILKVIMWSAVCAD